jgi:hypothetical protein
MFCRAFGDNYEVHTVKLDEQSSSRWAVYELVGDVPIKFQLFSNYEEAHQIYERWASGLRLYEEIMYPIADGPAPPGTLTVHNRPSGTVISIHK